MFYIHREVLNKFQQVIHITFFSTKDILLGKKYGIHRKYTKICAFKILPYGIVRESWWWFKERNVNIKKWMKFSISMLYSLSGSSLRSMGDVHPNPDLRATNTINGTHWKLSLTSDTTLSLA